LQFRPMDPNMWEERGSKICKNQE